MRRDLSLSLWMIAWATLTGLLVTAALLAALGSALDPCDADGVYICSQPPVPLQTEAPW